MQPDETDESLTEEEIGHLLYGSTFEKISEAHILHAVFERLPYSLARRFKELYFDFTAEDLERAVDHCFQFEDLIALTDRSLQNLLISVPAETLAAALSGTSEVFREKLLNNVTRAKAETAGRLLKPEYDIMTVTSARDDILRPLENRIHRQLRRKETETNQQGKE